MAAPRDEYSSKGLPMAAVAVVALLVVFGCGSSVSASAVSKSNNGTYGMTCHECRIAEDLELEMIMIDDLYYATAHFGRMLENFKEEKPTPTQQTKNPKVTPCRTKPGQQSNCSTDKDNNNNKNCKDPYDRGCRK